MPHTVLWLMVAGAVVTAAILGEAWRGEPAILSHAAKPAASSPAVPAPSPPVDAATSSCSMAIRSWSRIRPMQTANGSSLHRIRRSALANMNCA